MTEGVLGPISLGPSCPNRVQDEGQVVVTCGSMALTRKRVASVVHDRPYEFGDPKRLIDILGLLRFRPHYATALPGLDGGGGMKDDRG